MIDPAHQRAGLTLRAMVPNAITAAALCAGLTGIRFAIMGDWEKAVIAIILAGMLDGIDGRIARLLKAQSRFGAELDSLADNVSFGVAPALIEQAARLSGLPVGPLQLVDETSIDLGLKIARATRETHPVEWARFVEYAALDILPDPRIRQQRIGKAQIANEQNIHIALC